MSNTNSYREHVPNELAKELLTNSKPVAKYFNKKLNDNIDILKEEEIVNKDAPDIKNESGEIKDGKISENIIDIALYKHMASIELIKALIIAKFADKWKEVYLKYYTEKGEPNTIQNKNESNISTIDSKGKEQNEIHKSVICTFESIPFDTSKDNYNILILPFRNPEKNKEMTSLGENLAFGLIEKNNVQKLGLEIKYFSSYVDYISYKEAREIGNMYNADMVIWGNDSIQEGKSHIIYFHYVNIKGEYM